MKADINSDWRLPGAVLADSDGLKCLAKPQRRVFNLRVDKENGREFRSMVLRRYD